MTWEYVAGFFDGEGCVGLASNHRYGFSVRLALAQNGKRGQVLLDEIATFLSKHGITCSRPKPYRETHYLVTASRDSATKMLKALLPYLRIKKLEAQDRLRMLTIYPALPRGGRLSWEGRKQ